MKIFFIFLLLSITYSCLSKPINIEKYLPKDHVKDGSIDYTQYLQKGLDENLNIQLPDFPILVNENGLNVRSNQTLNFSKGSVLIMKPNSQERYGILNLKNVQNVIINNPHLIGDRDKHLGKSGEWGMGINILSSTNVTVKNSNISKCWGDGIYIGEILHKERGNYNLEEFASKNIKITGGIIDDNRRNGISIISVKGLIIENMLIQNTSGTMPMAGIDIEPNNNEQFLENIVLRSIVTKNNKEVGIKYVVSGFLGHRNKDVSIEIENCQDQGSKVGLFLGGARASYAKEIKKLSGYIKIANISLSDNQEPVRYGSIQKFNPEISINSLKVFKNNKRVAEKESAIISGLGKKGIKVSR